MTTRLCINFTGVRRRARDSERGERAIASRYKLCVPLLQSRKRGIEMLQKFTIGGKHAWASESIIVYAPTQDFYLVGGTALCIVYGA